VRVRQHSTKNRTRRPDAINIETALNTKGEFAPMASAIKSILFVPRAQRVQPQENSGFTPSNRLSFLRTIPPFESCRLRSVSTRITGAPLYAPSRTAVRRTLYGTDKPAAGEVGLRISVLSAGLLLGFSAAYVAQAPLTAGRITLLAVIGVVILLGQICHVSGYSAFGHETYTSDVREVLANLFNDTMTFETCTEWGEINELKYLFRGGQPWTLMQAHALISAAWDYWDFE
jgi:hypothetical protein